MDRNMKPKLRCRAKDLTEIAQRYQYPREDAVLLALRDPILARGYLTKRELLAVARWKAPRSAGRIGANDEEYVQEITRYSLGARTERARIETLTLLDGIQWPCASVILHFFHRGRYPILDFRALWTVSLKVPSQYGFEFWWQYVMYCRELAEQAGLDMRTLDQALWQYSKENQARV
ncbi:MAG: hypothetical protein ABIG68_01405 [Acidobacteriota bacterium]